MGESVLRFGTTHRPSSSRNLRRALLIAGMHRSGTSALTGVLGLLGGGLPRHLMPGSISNPDGFFEPQAIVDYHDRILASIGLRGLDWRPLPAAWFDGPEAAQAAHELRRILAEEYRGAGLILVKDPRLCLLLPLWLRILETAAVEPSIIIPVRNPIEVATSLGVRDGMSFDEAMLTWLRLFLAAEFDSRGTRRCLTRYDDLLADWPSLVAEIEAALGLDWPAMTTARHQEIDRFLQRSRRHHWAGAAEVEAHPEIHPWVKEVYRFCVSGRPLAAGLELFDQVRRELTRADLAYGGIVGRHRHATPGPADDDTALPTSATLASGVLPSSAPLRTELCGWADALTRSTSWRMTAPLRLEQAAAEPAGLDEADPLSAVRQIRHVYESASWEVMAPVRLVLKLRGRLVRR